MHTEESKGERKEQISTRDETKRDAKVLVHIKGMKKRTKRTTSERSIDKVKEAGQSKKRIVCRSLSELECI